MVHRWSRSGSQDTVSHDISMRSGPEQAKQLADPRPAGSTDLVDAVVRNIFHTKHILKFSLNSFKENVSLSSSGFTTNSRETVRGRERGMRPANVTECYVDESRIRENAIQMSTTVYTGSAFSLQLQHDGFFQRTMRVLHCRWWSFGIFLV